MSSNAPEQPPLPRVNGRHRNRALAAARRARAVRLRTQGMTYQQIADELGYTHRASVYQVVKRALDTHNAEAVRQLRDLENARLDALQVALWDAAMAGNVNSAMAIARIIAARVRLNGLSATSLAPTVSQPITVVQRQQ
ncbi:helix-turn-helix domain-containing protein [Ornithinimicrobium cryptoxanthini]|uniref:Helix-turn-helix domain-containing protein n=1 Tax=Ornithinimicrobium cryptoxanthini TaxID=2934161 RepID=A0ABY4YFL0_9MICO|nr:helix-turn-helix domain-containing protein [Ornithinimicrobium cryptoxanthini]USQ75345.1 helix-turn-helix domain-containing protein [Ornithinimicrobium cryptoxanthini]